MSQKSTKEHEMKIHNQIYENINLLTFVRPPPPEFHAVFKRDMFVKSNKAAFHQVVYYLLYTLNPEKTKEKITSWPIYEVRMESQFRTELMRYLNELNTMYEDANINNIMMSHFLCPGGMKFATFIWNLSQLVLTEYLKATGEFPHMLLPVKWKKNNKEGCQKRVEQLKRVTDAINEDTQKLKQDFNETLQSYRAETDSILSNLQNLTVLLPELRTKLAQLESERDDFIVDHADYDEKLAMIQTRISEITDKKDKFRDASELVDYLLNERSTLTYKSGNFKVPQEVSHVLNENANNLSLIKLVEAFMILFERKLFEVRTIDVGEHCEQYEAANENLAALRRDFDEVKKTFDVLLASLLKYGEDKRRGKVARMINVGSDSLDSTLATPLQDSPI